MKLDIVIPNYNGYELIKHQLPKLIEGLGKYDVGKIIIVDDFSKSEDFKNLEHLVSQINGKVTLIRNSKNLGFSSTVNNGAMLATSELVLLLNSDVMVEEGFLDDAIKDIASDRELFGVGLMDKSVEGEEVILRGRGVASWSRGFLVHERGEVDKSDTFWISGGSSLVRREIFLKLNGFDSLYNPFYWEDIDLSYRARKSGYKLIFESRSVVTHYHSKGAIKKQE